MAGRGFPPKDPAIRRRRNKPTVPTTTVQADGRLRGPVLPKDAIDEAWHPMTVRWWENWRRSPQAKVLTATDWDSLLETAVMHHEFWASRDFKLAAEIRLRVAKFGATLDDRKRLHLDLEPPAAPANPPAAVPVGVATLDDRRARLSS